MEFQFDSKDCCQCKGTPLESLALDSEMNSQEKLDLFELKKREFLLRHADVPHWLGMLSERRR